MRSIGTSDDRPGDRIYLDHFARASVGDGAAMIAWIPFNWIILREKSGEVLDEAAERRDLMNAVLRCARRTFAAIRYHPESRSITLEARDRP